MSNNSEVVQIRPLGHTKLFEPIAIGAHTLPQRIAFAPSTRQRGTVDYYPTDLQLPYYKARAQYPGTLVITEATYVAPGGAGRANVPGIWNDKQAAGWKKITDAIRQEKSFSSIQLWHLGRTADPEQLKRDGQAFIASSAIYMDQESEQHAKKVGNELRAATKEEIEDLINNVYPNGARKALDAGFDFIELHSAHGYFLDQFLNPVTNHRTDEYGGSIENRARLLLAIIDKLIPIVGAQRLAVRLSPWATFQVSDPEGAEIHAYILDQLQKRADEGNELAYISLVEPRVSASYDVAIEDQRGRSNAFADEHWKGKFVKAGNYTYDAPKFETMLHDLGNGRTVIAFSRFFTSNPDLVYRLKNGLPLQHYDRPTFYTHDNYGYNTWNSYDGSEQFDKEAEQKRVGKVLA